MAEDRNRRNQQNQNPLASLFSGFGQNGGPFSFLTQFFAAITAMFSGNFSSLTNLFTDSDASPARAERSIFQRGRDAVGDAFNSGREAVTGIYQRGRNALLNLIGQHESGGDYNRVYGPGQRRMPLTNMTINQVLAWQDRYTDNGSPSSAAGKYQIIENTLRGLKREMGLTGNERFDAAMQDRMAEVLVQRRVRESTRNGQVNEALLVRNLSKEWASLPRDSSGRSYYDGDGLNRAHASHASVRRAIDATFTDEGNVRYSAAARTGQSLSNTPRITSQLNGAASDAPAPRATQVAAPAAPRPLLQMPTFSFS